MDKAAHFFGGSTRKLAVFLSRMAFRIAHRVLVVRLLGRGRWMIPARLMQLKWTLAKARSLNTQKIFGRARSREARGGNAFEFTPNCQERT